MIALPALPDDNLIYQRETLEIRGACCEVYREKGCGFIESVYRECLEIEFDLRGIPWEPQPTAKLTYKGHKLRTGFQPDFICWEKIVVELKAAKEVTAEHRAQVHHYLRAARHRVGLLVNFGHFPGIEIERIEC